MKSKPWIVLVASLLTVELVAQDALRLNEAPTGVDEWGYRPAAQSVVRVTPPAFSWRPQRGMTAWELQVGEGRSFDRVAYCIEGVRWNVHCPPQTLPPGGYVWRYRGVDRKGRRTSWSRPRSFTIAEGAGALPLPARDELLARIPREHPRLFLRPEELPSLRERAAGVQAKEFRQLVRQCDKLLRQPPPTAEPPKYPRGSRRGSEAWRKIWWGNRTYTIRTLNGAATLAFTRMLGGKAEYGRLAKRILLACARWDPKGSTGYRYNDEAGMPYAYYFCRTYTFLHDLLSDEERALCRKVMTLRGREMYRHLCPQHFWRPYSSHSNRAWHFLGEVAIAFHEEIPEAGDWVWFAANVFACAYPVWSDDDGGWHEGSNYCASYLGRFTWWADVMRSALKIDAFRKPFFAQTGYYFHYLMPPGKLGGGFGDLTARRRAEQNRRIMTTFTGQARNPHWQWYVDTIGGPQPEKGYVGFVRGGRPGIESKPPDDLPTSRLFRGTGQAVLNSNLQDARAGVQVVFKSSPFGTRSHGYEANNAFLLWAYGKRLLIRSGRRDSYGSKHHREWMWSTRSVNCVTVDGHGQLRRNGRGRGRITEFKTTPRVDVVVGEAGGAYRQGKKRLLDRFTRTIVFVKPDLVVVHDRLVAKSPSTFNYWLHAVNEMAVKDQDHIRIRAGDVVCDAAILLPRGLSFAQTNEYDPNPRPRIKLREWHLSATTATKAKDTQFVAIYRPHRVGDAVPMKAEATASENGLVVRAALGDGEAVIVLPVRGVSVEVRDGKGAVTEAVRVDGERRSGR